MEQFDWNKLIIIVGRRNEWIQIKDAIKVSLILLTVSMSYPSSVMKIAYYKDILVWYLHFWFI